MRHVTDGELHAFLDGGLEHLPEDRAEEIRDHLAVCGACRERLQDEESVKGRAEEILGHQVVAAGSLPTFEELRQRAGAPGVIPGTEVADAPAPRYRGPIKGVPLAWAATIVLALGVGWMGGRVWRALPADSPGFRYEPIQLNSVQRADLQPGPEDSSISPEGRKDPSAPVEASEVERARLVEGDREEPEPTPAGVPAAAAPSVGGRGAGVSREAVPPLPGDVENSLALPGLRVVAIEWEERVKGEKALLIRQLLSPGDTLELRYLGMLLGTDPEPGAARRPGVASEEISRTRLYANILEASLPPGWSQVAMERNRGLLVARGPISEENLKALLKTLH